MAESKSHLSQAKKHISTGEHLLTVSYPMIKDEKLLIATLDNLYLAIEKILDGILTFEREQKRIPPYDNSFDSKLNAFKLKVMPHYDISKEMVDIIADIQYLREKRKKAPVEFKRDNNLVICDENYKMDVLSEDMLKHKIMKVKNLLKLIEELAI